jgi:hypothetical protein
MTTCAASGVHRNIEEPSAVPCAVEQIVDAGGGGVFRNSTIGLSYSTNRVAVADSSQG